jgi:preprotein translocase subunit SecY
MNWLGKIGYIFKDRQLRNKIFFVLFAFAIFRLAANIPIPGIATEDLQKFFGESQILGLLNLFSGGALSNISIVMLGMSPYITAVIILQLLTMIFPALEKLYKEEGEQGKQRFNQYGRIATVPLAALQGYGMLILFQNQGLISFLTPISFFTSIIIVTCGSVFLMWLGELISERGIGNGVSLLIFAGIIARTPIEIRNIIATWDVSNLPFYILFFFVSLLIIAGVVIVNEGKRNIPVSYAKRVRGNKMYGGFSTYLPININPAGVLPIIFAMSILLFPGMIANFLSGSANETLANIAQGVNNFLQNAWIYGLLYFILVFLFTYFYTSVTFNPETVANNLQKMGGFISGIRPGRPTAEFLHKVLYKILFIGAIFLGTIAVMPSIIQGITGIQSFTFLIGGTALLIMVSVILDFWRQLKAQLEMREYEDF